MNRAFHKKLLALMIAGGMAITGSGMALAAEKADYLLPDTIPTPEDNQLTPERIELGLNLFFDPRLSGSNWISCGTCHNPALGWSDTQPTAIGHGMHVIARGTPTILNTGFNTFQFWDGRARTLEEQAVGPIQAEGEMNQDMEELVGELKAIDGYVRMFEAAYPGEGITEETIAKAIASYERSIISTDSPFDLWIKGDENAINKSAKRGFELFEGKGRCVICHSGFNFTDNGFHNLGLKHDGEPDLGRYNVRKVKILPGAFKTPILRDVTLTAPYLHNAMYATLQEVMEHYNPGGDVQKDLSPNMQPLNLTKQEMADLVEFMKSLTSIEPIKVTIPVLPQ